MKFKHNTVMAAHHAAFLQRAQAAGFGYERREAPDTRKLAETIDKIATAFEEY